MLGFILLCVAIGAFFISAQFRSIIGRGCLMFIIGFAVLAGVVWLLIAANSTPSKASHPVKTTHAKIV